MRLMYLRTKLYPLYPAEAKAEEYVGEENNSVRESLNINIQSSKVIIRLMSDTWTEIFKGRRVGTMPRR